MVLRVEKQREVHGSYNDNIESNALLAKTQFYKKEGMESIKKEEGSGRGNSKRVDKANKHCSHYNMNGHVKETCFKLHGYSDWYKDLKGGKGSGRNVANMVDTPLDIEDDNEDKKSNRVLLLICQGQKAFQAYDVESHKVYVIRDIVFHESIFPFSKSLEHTDALPLPIVTETDDILNTPQLDQPIEPEIQLNDLTPEISEQNDIEPIPPSPIAPDQSPTQSTLVPRRSTRPKQKPICLNDFVTNMATASTLPTARIFD
ncbi:TPA_asm: hypothetical protein HUJ06_032017 [Nelumbo nucifera]|uniref:Retroviral polymerase SH3-like domain-containing protein n=1 Tax=Nelumbo nucifera TaxID=4432 RepID=A0A823A5F7_NELNU|nr:TPA_asm: hypothetical protein HUJ06_032017 [Nelumbo nucifera]